MFFIFRPKEENNRIVLQIDSLNLRIGEHYVLDAYSLNKNGKKEKVFFSSSNPEVVSVDEETGYLTVKDYGKAKIIVMLMSDPNVFKVCEINVIEDEVKPSADGTISVTGVTLVKNKTTLNVGGSEKLEYIISPKNATNKAVKWISNHPEVVSVSEDGTITGLALGTATISVITVDGAKVEQIKVSVIVPANPVKSISLTKKSVSIDINKTEKLNYVLEPKNASNQSVTWKSSDPNIVTVDSNGVIFGRSPGNAVITVTTNDGGRQASVSVTVKNVVIPVTGVSLNDNFVTLAIGSSETLVATVKPSNAINKQVTWFSNNPSVALVDANGTVKAISEGVAVVTVTTVDGAKTDKATITVKRVPVSSVSLNKTSATISIGSSEKIIATVNPSNATNKNVSWSSNNPSVASVDNDGTVHAVSLGTTTIVVTTKDGSKTAKATVTVTPVMVSSVTLNKTSETAYINGNNSKIALTATVHPSNASDQSITWSSSNPDCATVDSAGVVTLKNTGRTTVTATVGGKSATYQLLVKRKIIIVIGASQVSRMRVVVGSYTSNNCTYSKSDTTLKYIDLGGSGFSYQINSGWTTTKNFIKNRENEKEFNEYYIYLPISGNEIQKYKCADITTSNTSISDSLNSMNNNIQSLKDESYFIRAYIVSCQPVKPTQGGSVKNTNKAACNVGYRSNLKYYTFNKVARALVPNYNNLEYVETFTKIVEVNETGEDYPFLVTYNTTDGIHWTDATTTAYVKYMLEDNPNI